MCLSATTAPNRRYLDLLRAALLDQHYLENELRIEHLLESIAGGGDVNPGKLADPARYMSVALRRLQRQREAGEVGGDWASPAGDWNGLAYATLGRVHLEHLERCVRMVRDDAVAGDLVEAGAGRGGPAIFIRGCIEAYELPDARLWVADRFDGRGPRSAGGDPRFTADLNSVRDAFARFDLLDARTVFRQGPPSRTLAEAAVGEIALLHLGPEDPDEICALLDALYDRVAPRRFCRHRRLRDGGRPGKR